MADLRGWPFPMPGEKRINWRIEMYYLSRVSVCAINVCFHCVWIGRQEQREVVLEFRDNPLCGFQGTVNLVFLLVRHRELSYKE